MTAALHVGAVSADVVAVEARRAQPPNRRPSVDDPDDGGATSDRHLVAHHGRAREQRVVSLTQRRLADPAAVIAGLPPDTRPLPSVAAYDELLPRRRTSHRPSEPGPNEGSSS